MSKFLHITPDMTLTQLSNQIGSTNVDRFLNANSLERTRNIGKEYQKLTESVKYGDAVPNQRKCTLLNMLTANSDVFELVALLTEAGWRQLDKFGNLPDYMVIPDSIEIADSVEVVGNNKPIPGEIYKQVMSQIRKFGIADPSSFNTFSSITEAGITQPILGTSGNSPYYFQAFKLPWGDITLYSSLSDESIDFPVYPKDPSDTRKANYTTMPNLLYQYEPWQLYESSGPRDNQYVFEFHRDMWTGDHRDGKAIELIRFCEANCYPEYRGSTVNTSTVTLYIKGRPLITGILTEAHTDWSGPIGLDGWQLMCTLTLSITEVSDTPLDYDTIKNKPLIG